MTVIKTITGIHGVPRSGTSWLAQIFNSSPEVNLKFQPLFSYEFKGFLKTNSSKEEICSFFEKLYVSDSDFINMRDIKIHSSYPTFKKKESRPHLIFKHVRYHYLIETMLKNENVKFILLVRNPFAVLNSWKNNNREFNSEWQFEEEWKFAKKKNQNRVEEYFGYEKWKEATTLFIDLQTRYPDQVTICRYDDLLRETDIEVKRLFKFSGIIISKEVEKFLKESRSVTINDVNSVFNTKADDSGWKNQIDDRIYDYIKSDLTNTKLYKFLSI